MDCKKDKSVVIDIDGVCADFEKAFCEKYGWNNRHLVSLEERYLNREEEIREFVISPETYENLEIIENGKKLANFFHYEGYKVFLISARPANTHLVTFSWLKKHKIIFDFMHVGDKLNRIKILQPSFVVDDLLSVCEYVSDELNIPSFLIDYPWNQQKYLSGNIHRIRDFSEFLRIFSRIY